jgi:GTPase SAR1 family protein
MIRTSSAVALAERLCRPQRIGLFGHRGVGKTTLLTMLYREAVGGRLPELRLAAGDASTANYLADKVLQLESGSLLPATLAETALRFQLYHRGSRLELIVKDYQGEHVAVGRQEPIREFLRDCDAVWLCFDPELLDSSAERLRGEQEAEQMIEDYLKLDSEGPPRPMALVLTKADLLPPHHPEAGDDWVEDLARDHFGMTLHALKEHAPRNAVFAVSSLGRRESADALVLADEKERPAPSTPAPLPPLHPQNLDRPLRWLVEALQVQDEARLDKLFEAAPGNVRLLEKCVRCFGQRHAGSARLAEFEGRLRKCRTRQRLRRGLVGTAVAVLTALGVWAFDAIQYQSAQAFEKSTEDPSARRDKWKEYLDHPLSIGWRKEAEERVRRLESQARDEKRERDRAALEKLVGDESAKSSDLQARLKQFRTDFPDMPGLEPFCRQVEEKVGPLRAREAKDALDELARGESLAGTKGEGEALRKHLEGLVKQADGALKDYPDTPSTGELRKKRLAYLHRIDEHDFETARAYSRKEPLNFATRRERYQKYLGLHPEGAFARQARDAVAEVEAAWDKHDFRPVRDLFVSKPTEYAKLTALCEHYLSVHENGKYRKSARDVVAWVERVKGAREYTVKALRGDFSVKLGRWFTKGPDLAVEIEVNGVKHGPTNIVKNNYDPKWDYEFPRPIKWQPGDKVRILITDHDFGTVRLGRTILDYTSDDGDQLAMRHLSGKFEFKYRDDTQTLWFESDFNMPTLPPVE